VARNREAGTDSGSREWAPPWSAAIAAAARADDPEPLLRPIIAGFGFDGLTSIALCSSTGRERVQGFWSTAPAAWTARYCECAYAAVDPRVALTSDRLSPVIWDAADIDAGWHAQRFLADAACYGARSGVAVAFQDTSSLRTIVALDSAASPLTDARCAELIVRLGDLMLLAAMLHDRVLRPRTDAPGGACVKVGDAPLTHRERQCLVMAAHGQTSGDIGGKLGIAERTVNFHMRNMMRKLDALNRPEAIARALAHGVVDASVIAQRIPDSGR
jgi:DNA-binding CsgD family transcriptional regulator